MLNLAAIHEAIAAVAPDRECLIFRDRRFTWSQTTDRTRRLASVLRAHGLVRKVPHTHRYMVTRHGQTAAAALLAARAANTRKLSELAA